MMHKICFSFIIIIIFISCSNKETLPKNKNSITEYKLLVMPQQNQTPTVDIKEYKLVEAQNEDRKKDAAAILSLKRAWPLVMQNPGRAGFDSILSQHFTFTGNGQLLNREAYIIDRTAASDWKITHVKYDNLTLQFFENSALLTYRNQVSNENIKTGEKEMEYISWADIYTIENSKWKIAATHTIDFSLENK